MVAVWGDGKIVVTLLSRCTAVRYLFSSKPVLKLSFDYYLQILSKQR